MKNRFVHSVKRALSLLLTAALLAAALLAVSPAAMALEGEELKTTEAAVYAADPLLVTGGHAAYLSGYSGGYFRPEASMTRAEVAQMLYNLLAQKLAVSTSKFSDVNAASWYAKAVNCLAESGVLKGYKDGTFLPNGTITRAEFVTALAQCFAMETGNVSFTDVPKSSWAYKYIQSACAKGWLNGYSDGTFRPNRSIKRCEAVKIVNVALGRKGDGFAADRNQQKFKDVSKDHWAFLEIAEAANPVGGETEPPPATGFDAGDTVYVTATALNLREGPSTSSKSLAVLSKGTALTITQVASSGWLAVKTSDGRSGYVSSSYVSKDKPDPSSGLKLSASNLSLRQYQSIRLDGSVRSGDISGTSWSSSDPSVAVVGYVVKYNSKEAGAMVYAKKPGAATITFTNADGASKVSCVIQVGAAESVRFAYADQNMVPNGGTFNLVAITDAGHSSVRFQIVNGPATGSYETSSYTTASQTSSFGLPVNTVRVFKRSVRFDRAGTYTVRAFSGGSDYYEFTVMVSTSAAAGATETTTSSRRASTEVIRLLANFEGFWNEAKDDPLAPKHPTVGHGYVVPVNSVFYNNMTSEEAFAFLVNTVNKQTYASSVEKFRSANGLKMSQAQFDALTSFAYNFGPGELNTGYDTFKVLLNAVIPPSDLSSNPRTGVLNAGSSHLYKDASWSSEKVAPVKNGASVTVTAARFIAATHQMWYQAQCDGKTGWIPAGFVHLNGAGLTKDLAYTDATALAYNYLQWCHASGKLVEGLVWRRLAECKMFLFGNYSEAYHSSPNYTRNTYGFLYPEECRHLDRR